MTRLGVDKMSEQPESCYCGSTAFENIFLVGLSQYDEQQRVKYNAYACIQCGCMYIGILK